MGCHAVSAGAGPRAPALCDNPRRAARSDRGKVRRRLQQAELDPDEGGPLLLHLLDIPAEMERLATLSPPERKARTFAPPAPCPARGAVSPCILTMENLHWSDATSEEWLTSLVERLASTALLVLVTYRPGYQPSGWRSRTRPKSRCRVCDLVTVGRWCRQCRTRQCQRRWSGDRDASGESLLLEELAWNVIEHGGPRHWPCRRRLRRCWRHALIACRRKRSACCRPLPSSEWMSPCRSSRP